MSATPRLGRAVTLPGQLNGQAEGAAERCPQERLLGPGTNLTVKPKPQAVLERAAAMQYPAKV